MPAGDKKQSVSANSIYKTIPIEIWNNFIKGESTSFSYIYYMYIQDLYAYGRCFTSNRELLKECIHEVFVKIYYSREDLRIDYFKYYMIKSLRNQLLNAFRDEKDTCDVEEFENEFMPVYSVEDSYIQKEQDIRLKLEIRKMLASLTSNQREAIYYRYIEELSINEISQIMDINYQSVINLIHRSIKKMREENSSNELFSLILKKTV